MDQAQTVGPREAMTIPLVGHEKQVGACSGYTLTSLGTVLVESCYGSVITCRNLLQTPGSEIDNPIPSHEEYPLHM
jgi:hypothetical protein